MITFKKKKTHDNIERNKMKHITNIKVSNEIVDFFSFKDEQRDDWSNFQAIERTKAKV